MKEKIKKEEEKKESELKTNNIGIKCFLF